MFICKFQFQHSFTKWYEEAEKVHQGSINVFLSSQQYQDFIKVFQKKPESYVIIPGIANMLFDEFSLFQQTNMVNQWQNIFISLLINLQKRTKGLSQSLRNMKGKGDQDFNYIACSSKMEDKIIKSVGGENVSGFYKLKVFQTDDEFIKIVVSKYQDDVQYALNRTRMFIEQHGGPASFPFIPSELQAVLMQNSN